MQRINKVITRAGKVPCDYEADFVHTLEEPFRGTYYRDNPAEYMDVITDSFGLGYTVAEMMELYNMQI